MHADSDTGLDRKALKRTGLRFQQVNQQRLERALSALSGRQAVLLELLPLLMHVNHPMLPGYVSSQTPAGVSGYSPSRTDIARAQRLSRSFTWRREPHLDCQIQSIFLMGSVGTVAQSTGSDLDIWVCHPSGLERRAFGELRRKCDQISEWAESLGLEVHFFLMDADKFRRGQRERLGGEDCGSAQHALLLDEFYRTAILLAGAPPLWWLVPPGLEQAHDDYAQTLQGKRYVPPGSHVDFGGVAHIPAGEFVGAGIWQLYKAIESPYKSLLKLMVMEAYASDYPAVDTLCREFKQAVYAERLDIDELDPYIMIYRRLERYLQARNESERLELARRCLYVKVGKALSRPPADGRKSWQRLLMERLVAEWGWSPAQLANLDARRYWKAGRVMEEQRLLVRELVFSYRLLSDFARRHAGSATINQRELTILGRKLYCAFERKAGKVELINPGIAQDLSEEYLVLAELPARDGEAGQQWAVFNGQDAGRHPPLKRCRTLLELLAWCHLNGLLASDTRLSLMPGSRSSEAEIHQIARLLQQRLPLQGARPLASDEDYQRVVTPRLWLLLVNVGADPQQHMLRQGKTRISSQTDSLGYSGLKENLVVNLELLCISSWGEISCRRFEGPQALQDCVADYLQQLPAGQRLALPALHIHSFCPTRPHAIAARVEELFRDIIACYHGGTRPPGTRYLLEIQGQYWLLGIQGRLPQWQRARDLPALLALLGQPSEDVSPLVVDRHALHGQPLAAVLQHAGPDSISVFYLAEEHEAQLYVVDERGALVSWRTAFRDEATLLAPLDRFLLSILLRQNAEGLRDDGTVPEVRYFQLNRQAGRFQAQPRNVPQQEGYFHNLQALGEQGPDGVQYTLYFDQQEFNALDHGRDLYRVVAGWILSRRRHQERYPVYITDLDLSQLQEGPRQTSHYLRHKQRLEEALNRALQDA